MTTHTEKDMSEHPTLDEPRPGHELREARERAGISRDSMAERLHLAPAQLDALERDDYAELPPPAFVRGYFRSYARELGLDHDEYIAAYNRSGVSARDPEIRSGGVTEPGSGGRGGMIGLLLIALVAAGGIGAWWYQQRTGAGTGDSGATGTVEEERTAADTADADPETDPDTGDAPSGGTGTDDAADDTAAGTDAGSDAASPEGDDTDTASGGNTQGGDGAASDSDAAEAMAAAAEGVDADAGDDVDEAASGDGADAYEAAGDATEQPVVATADTDSPQSGGDEAAADAGPSAGDEGGGSGDGAGDDADAPTATETADDDAAADDAETNSAAAAAEPGATSPAATDSPTRAATEAARSGPDQVTLEFASRSWLEVYDDRNRELVYTLYFGSEPITLQGYAPFEISLGNSPAVTVRFNGEVIDKSAFNRGNNTARFLVDASGVRAP